MHWVKLMVEMWVLIGVVTVILGLLWTSKLAKKPQLNLVKSAPPPAQAEISSSNLGKIRSA
ncbi:MAG: hypothetical protein WB952_20295 [Terriglobales bacterium]